MLGSELGSGGVVTRVLREVVQVPSSIVDRLLIASVQVQSPLLAAQQEPETPASVALVLASDAPISSQVMLKLLKHSAV